MRNKLIILSFLWIGFSGHAQIFTINMGGTVNTCAATIYDSGGVGANYGNFENYTMTFCGINPGDCIQLDFLNFGVDFSDFLNVYNGPTTASPLIGSYNDFTLPPPSISTSNNCITLQFVSDFFFTSSGFELSLNCFACPTCFDGVMNGLETGIDCGGPDCAACPCSDINIPAIPFVDNNSTCGAGNDLFFPTVCTSFFADGEDIVYEYTATTDDCLVMDLNYDFPGGAGLFVLDGCPGNFGTNCVYIQESPFGMTSMSGFVPLITGTTYYIVISSQGFGSCMNYTLDLTIGCPMPTFQDCLGAIPICSESFDVEDPIGEGTFPGELDIFNGCLTSGELNSIWYTFTVQADGNLCFILTPNNPNQDYDWALFDLTNSICDEIFTDPFIQVSCNSYGVLGVNGPTGMSWANGGSGSSNGPGNLNGPPFNDELFVSAGQEYVLMISNWSGGLAGFNMDFSCSTAQLFDPNLLIQVTPVITNEFCNLGNGVVDATNTMGGMPPYNYEFNNIVQGTSVFTGIQAGMYELLVSGTDNCAVTIPIEITDSTITTNAGLDSALCALSIDLSAQSQPNFTGTWTGPGQVSFNNANSPSPTVTSTSGGPASLVWTIDDGNGCVVSDQVTITFTEGVVIDVSAFDELCPALCDGIASAEASGGNVALNYTYIFSGGTPSGTPGEVFNLCPGNYTVIASDDNDCEGTENFVINAAVPISIDSVHTFAETCPTDCDGSIEIFGTNSNEYSIDGGFIFSGSPIFNNLCPGEYPLMIRNPGGCIDEGSIMVAPGIAPVAFFKVSPAFAPYTDPTFTFTNQSVGYIESDWLFGFLPFYDTSTEMSPIITFLNAQPGEIDVQLIVTNELGCKDTVLHTIRIVDEFNIFAPNTFTPDGDGVNDLFFMQGTDLDNARFELEIYDRWGGLVFSSFDISIGWNGSNLNTEYFVEDGVYVWHLITRSLSTQEDVELMGHVIIIR